MTLSATPPDGYCSSGGWWIAGDTLVAFINVWPSDLEARGGYVQYMQSTDGLNWTPQKRVTMKNGSTLDGIFEQDPHALPDGRIIGAAHFQPGLLIAPVYTDDPSGIRGWVRPAFTNMDYSGTVTREIEPSWFRRKDGGVVMIFRDQNSSFFKLASLSTDRGASWSTPVLTDMPDSRSKQSAGNLPDSTAFMVSNPVDNKTRIPLVITLSSDGMLFDKAYVLRRGGSDLQEQRYSGTSKGLGYVYPKSTVWGQYLYVAYSTNKEDVQCTRIPLASISLNTVPVRTPTASTEKKGISITGGTGKLLTVTLPGSGTTGTITLYRIDGNVVLRRTTAGTTAHISTAHLNAGMYVLEAGTGNTVEVRKIHLH